MKLKHAFKKHGRPWFIDLPLDRKFLLVYIVPMFLMLTLSLGALQLALSVYDKIISQNTLKELEFFIDKVDGAVGKLETLSFQMALDDVAQQSLYRNMKIEDLPRYQYEMRFVMMRFLHQVIAAETVECFIYTDGKRMTYVNGNRIVDLPEGSRRALLASSREAGGKLVIQTPTAEFPYLLAARDIRYYINADLSYLGTLILIADLSGIIEPYLKTRGSGKNHLFVYNGDVAIFSSSSDFVPSVSTLPEPKPYKGYSIQKISGKLFFIATAFSPQTSWEFVDMFPYDALFRTSIRTRAFLIVVFIFLYIVSIYAIRRLSLRVTEPLKELSESMAIVGEGKFDEALVALGEGFSSDEIGKLKSDYSMMLKTIRDLIKENYQKQLMIKDTQHRALKAQINPHFLYNTLNSVGWMIDFSRHTEARHMIGCLGKLLNRAFRPDVMTSVENEVSLLKDYIYIQKIRYEDRAEFLLDIDEGLGEILVPQLLLQPLVENALCHAVDISVGLCRIAISVSGTTDRLELSVADDGPGMTEETLNRVLSFQSSVKTSGIGLQNIHERLSLLYGESFGFSIQSGKDVGTTVRIVIPIEEVRG